MTLLALPPTARSSIRSSGFGTICAATGSPTRYFVAQRTSRRLRVGLEPVRHRSPPDPLALRGPLGSGFARSVGGVCDQTAAWSERHTFLSRKLRIFPESYEAPYNKGIASGKRPGEDEPCQRPGVSANSASQQVLKTPWGRQKAASFGNYLNCGPCSPLAKLRKEIGKIRPSISPAML